MLPIGQEAPSGASRFARFRCDATGSSKKLFVRSARLAKRYLPHIASSKMAGSALPCVADVDGEAGWSKDQICAFIELRIRLSHGLSRAMLSQTALATLVSNDRTLDPLIPLTRRIEDHRHGFVGSLVATLFQPHDRLLPKCIGPLRHQSLATRNACPPENGAAAPAGKISPMALRTRCLFSPSFMLARNEGWFIAAFPNARLCSYFPW